MLPSVLLSLPHTEATEKVAPELLAEMAGWKVYEPPQGEEVTEVCSMCASSDSSANQSSKECGIWGMLVSGRDPVNPDHIFW